MNHKGIEADEMYICYEDPCISKYLQESWVIGPFVLVEEALAFGIEMFGENERGIYWSFRRLEQHEINELIAPDDFREIIKSLDRPSVDDFLRDMKSSNHQDKGGGLLS